MENNNEVDYELFRERLDDVYPHLSDKQKKDILNLRFSIWLLVAEELFT